LLCELSHERRPFCPVSARDCGSKPNHIADEKFDNESVDYVFGIVINYHAPCSLSWSGIRLSASALRLSGGRSKLWAKPLLPSCDARDRVINGNGIRELAAAAQLGANLRHARFVPMEATGIERRLNVR